MTIEGFSPLSSLQATSNLSRVNETLASGSAINRAADNPAGQAIVTNLSSNINEQDVATRNANTGINLIQTADGASNQITEQLQRLNELSVQASNGTLNPSQRDILNQQFQQGLETVNQIANTTQFNGTNLLNGDTNNIEIALGEESSTISLSDLSSNGLGLSGLDLTNPANIDLAREGIANALQGVTDVRAQFGAQQNGLSSAVETLTEQNLNTIATRSQINDTDFARAFAEQVRQQVLNQAGIALQSQSNGDRANVLQLLS